MVSVKDDGGSITERLRVTQSGATVAGTVTVSTKLLSPRVETSGELQLAPNGGANHIAVSFASSALKFAPSWGGNSVMTFYSSGSEQTAPVHAGEGQAPSDRKQWVDTDHSAKFAYRGYTTNYHPEHHYYKRRSGLGDNKRELHLQSKRTHAQKQCVGGDSTRILEYFGCQQSQYAFQYLPKLHRLQAWIDRRSSGKTTACVSLLQRYMAIGAIDRVILISPTYESNRHAFSPLKIKDVDVIEPTTDAIDEVIAKLDEEMNEWLDYHRRKKEYSQFRKEMRGSAFTDAKLMMWDQMGFLDAVTEPKWKNADDSRPSRIYVLMDDIMGTNMLKMGKGQEKFVNLCIKHRHMLCHNGTAYGISIECLLQSYTHLTPLCRDRYARI